MLKLINYIINHGNKYSSEITFLKLSKNLQKTSNKNLSILLKLSLICSITIFKIDILTKTKQSITLIKNRPKRVYLAIKFIIKKTKNQKQVFYKKLSTQIFSILNNENLDILSQKKLQEQVFLKKQLFLYYR